MALSGGPTKDEVMALSLFKLGINESDVFADIGCGTGKISLEVSSVAMKVYAIDRRKEAIALAREKAESAGAENIELFCGEAIDILPTIDRIDCAFIGGSGNLDRVLRILHTFHTRSIVVNAVKIDTLNLAINTMEQLGIFKEALHLQVGKSHTLAGGIMFKPLDPVYIVVGGCPPCS
ncbi:MAG TPA: precorrin-6Y C5,15-methyltransferase (decarboxylating) subunit CbiT [Methanoregulaceae archaeon]|nr:precorrin-6Y C5,15-methyltransferase (decarboxylating) subunit CbiT [Methanoregulaceae archaeon]